MSTRRNAIGGLSLLPLLLIACSNAPTLPVVNALTVEPATQPTRPFVFRTLADPDFGSTYCEGINDGGVIAGFVRKRGIKGVSILPPYHRSDFHIFASRTVFFGFRGKDGAYGYRIGSNGVVWGFARRKGLRTTYRENASLDTEITGFYGKNGVVGFYVSGAGADIAYRLVDRKVQYITPPNSASAAATGVNSHGDIVGWTESSAGIVSAWVLQRGQFQTLEFPDAVDTQAFGINARGDVVGMYTAGNGRTHGFIASSPYAAGNWQTLDDPHAGSGAPTVATGINDHRAVVGWYMDGHGHTDGFLANPY